MSDKNGQMIEFADSVAALVSVWLSHLSIFSNVHRTKNTRQAGVFGLSGRMGCYGVDIYMAKMDILNGTRQFYWLNWPMMANIGKNIPATIVPTIPPKNTIISGSMAAVKLSTASSTSRS